MPSFMLPEEDLPASASPGLETLPAMSDMAGPTAGPVSSADAPDLTHFSLPSASSPAPKTSGLGLADFKSARGSDDDEYIKSLPTHQKIGLALQAFGAAVNGQPNPIDVLLENKRKREAEFRQELGATTQLIKGGIDMVKKIPPGPAREALVNMIARQAGPSGDTVRNALMSVGSEGEADIKDIVGVIDNPAAQAMLIKAASKSDDPKKEALKLLTDSDFRKNLESVADRATMPDVMSKMRVIADAMSRMPEFKTGEGKASYSMGELLDQNDKLPQEFRLTQGEIGTLRRNQILGAVYGLKTEQTTQKEQEAAAKPEKESMTEVAKLNADLAANRITKAQFDAEIRRRNLSSEKQDIKITLGADNALDPEELKMVAQQYLTGDKSAIQGYARNPTQRIALQKAIVAEAKAQGMSGADIAAQTAEFAGITAGSRAVGTRGANIELASAEAEQMIDIVKQKSSAFSGTNFVPWNKALSAYDTQTGAPEIKGLGAAINSLVNVYARAISPSGVPTISDKEHAREMLSKVDSPAQINEVLGVMKQEMAAARASPGQVRKTQREAVTGRRSTDAPKQASQFVEGQVYTDAQGRRAKYVNGTWVPQ